MNRRSIHVLFACVVGLVASVGVAVQPGDGFDPLPTVVVDDVFAPISVREAITRGKAEGRITVIVTALARPPRGREAWWTNAALRSWLLREAVVVWAQPRNADLLAWVSRADRGAAHSFAGMDIFVDGTHIPRAGGQASYEGRFSSDFSASLDDAAPVQLDDHPAPTAEWVLTMLDTQRELAMVRSPVFAHNARDRRSAEAVRPPEGKEPDTPPRPDPKNNPVAPVYSSAAPGIPAIMDLEREPSARWRAVIQRAAEAAVAAGSGKVGDAIAAWTWLWERSAVTDPAAAFIGELAMVAILESGERTELAGARLLALLEANPGDPARVSGRSTAPFGAPSDAALELLLSTVGSPSVCDFETAIGGTELAVWRACGRRSVLLLAVPPLRRLIQPDERRAAMALDENAAASMFADLRDARRPAIVDEREWEAIQSMRRAQIIALHARAAYLCTRAGGRLDIDAGHAARRLLLVAQSWPSIDRAAAARAVGLALVLAERRPPVLLDDVQKALDQADALDPSRPTFDLIDSVVALPDSVERRK